MTQANPSANVVGQFVVACLGARAWAVGFAHKPIPGAVLHTREAAIHYVSELAAAAGITRVHLHIVGGFGKQRSQRSALLRAICGGRIAHA